MKKVCLCGTDPALGRKFQCARKHGVIKAKASKQRNGRTISDKITLRPGKESDAHDCGRICWQAFTSISQKHNFTPDFPSAEVAIRLLTMVLTRPDLYSVVAEANGKIAGNGMSKEADQQRGFSLVLERGFAGQAADDLDEPGTL